MECDGCPLCICMYMYVYMYHLCGALSGSPQYLCMDHCHIICCGNTHMHNSVQEAELWKEM